MIFEGYKNLVITLVLLEILAIILTFHRRPTIAIFTTVASVFIFGQYIWIGVQIFAWHISALLGLLYLVTRRAPLNLNAGRNLSIFSTGIAAYFAYNVVISIIMWVVVHIEILPPQAIGTSTQRMASQSLYLLFQIGLFSFGIYAARKISLDRLITFIVRFSSLVAYLAILQILIFMFTRLDIFPIIGSDNTMRSAFILGESFRATSIMGEPKHLGILMAFGLGAFYIARIFGISTGRFSVQNPIAMVIALVLSFSTTGIVVSISSLIILMTLFARHVQKSDFVFLFILFPIALFQFLQANENFQAATLEQTGRIALERQDESVRDALLDNPLLAIVGTGVGNIHNYAVSYLPAEFPLFRDRGYKANSGLFYILGDSGLVGLSLFVGAHVFAFLSIFRATGRIRRFRQASRGAAGALLLISLFDFMLRYNAIHFFIMGFVFSHLIVLRVQERGTRLYATSNAGTRI